MAKIYVSSTYKDLKDYREAVHDALRKLRHDVVRMEDYVARDRHTKAACEADVGQCDLYVGIFAWRYGHVPSDDNPAGRSITELEYRKARQDGKTCLVFLIADDAPWPPSLMDAESDAEDRGQRIRTLRENLKKRCAGYFKSPHDLATQVIAAVYQDEATKRVRSLDVLNDIKGTVGIGPSYLPNLREKIKEAREAQIVEVRLGPTPWWTTRLHLAAALAEDFTRIRQFVLLDDQGRFVMMCAPRNLRRMLTKHSPSLEVGYLRSADAGPAADEVGAIEAIMMRWEEALFHAFGERPEPDVKEVVTPAMAKTMALDDTADTVELTGQAPSLVQYEIAKRQSPFVALLRAGHLEGVVDRLEMTTRIATDILQEWR